MEGLYTVITSRGKDGEWHTTTLHYGREITRELSEYTNKLLHETTQGHIAKMKCNPKIRMLEEILLLEE